MRRLPSIAVCLFCFLFSFALSAEETTPVHAIAMHGMPKYPPDFKHFNYVNPEAPKGGVLRMAAIGGFDNLNPFITRGIPPAGIGMTFETLLTSSADEAFSAYGLIAESIEMPSDRSWVAFTLRPEARWHDGTPITPEDVIFSLEILKTKGAPFYRFYYAGVTKVEKTSPQRVLFTFAPGDNRELPLIIGQMPILPKHYWEKQDFSKTTFTPPLGSGPYRLESFESNRFVVYRRVQDYWGKDLPVNRGFNNFNVIRYDYYRDTTVALEALKAGEYDLRMENESKKWATSYDFPAVRDGKVIVTTFPHHRTGGMQGFVYNLRRPIFQDPRVREALGYAFNFEWTNQALFYGQYTRTNSYFPNSELSSTGLPDAQELQFLEPLRDQIPPRVFTETYAPPVSDGSGYIRANLERARTLLEEAGWTLKNGKLVDAHGSPFVFEILLEQPVWERITLPFAQNLRFLGIDARIRTIDSAQYKTRTDDFDFDMIVDVFPQSSSPGNEQLDFWGSESAVTPGGRNTIGIKNKAIDTLASLIVAAPDRESLIARVRALDRVLLWNFYVIPHWYTAGDRMAYWNRFGMPDIIPDNGVQIMSWWIDTNKVDPLANRRTE